MIRKHSHVKSYQVEIIKLALSKVFISYIELGFQPHMASPKCIRPNITTNGEVRYYTYS